MDKSHMDFMIHFMRVVSRAYKEFKDRVEIKIEEEEGEDCWAIVMKFNYYSAEYKDVVIMYTNEDFKPEDIIEDMEDVINKAIKILKD